LKVLDKVSGSEEDQDPRDIDEAVNLQDSAKPHHGK
jgi:hypothetical protein